MKISFVKEHDIWYADLPDFTGAKAELAMMPSAAKLLDYFNVANATTIDFYVFKDKPTYYRFVLNKVKEGNGWAKYSSDYVSCLIDLCPVSKWFFGNHPEKIYVL